MKLKCFNVICIDSNMNKYEVGVMTTDEVAAKNCAINSLLEGKNIKAKAIEVFEVDSI